MTIEDRVARLEDLTLKIGELIVYHHSHLDEMRQENRMTRRIWIAIARKQNLFDDDEFRDVFGDEE